jgi:hypothetical protein
MGNAAINAAKATISEEIIAKEATIPDESCFKVCFTI